MSYKKYREKKNFIRGKYVIGVEPGDSSHKATVLDLTGCQIGKPFSFQVSYKGFNNTFFKKVHRLIGDYNKNEVCIAIESSCDMWQTFAHYLYKNGFTVLTVSPLSTYLSRGLLNNDFSKSDNKDSLLIAENAYNGKYISYREYNLLYRKLHRLSIAYDKILKCNTKFRLRIRGFIKRVFPEYLKVIEFRTKTSDYLLGKYFTPEDFLKLDITQEESVIMKLSISQHGEQTLLKIKEAAQQSIGIDLEVEEKEICRKVLDSHLALAKKTEEQINIIMPELIKLAKQTPYFEILTSIKGISDKLADQFIAECHGLDDFSHYKQLEKYAGLNIRIKQSGKQSGARHVNKMGNKRLSRIIYQMTEQAIRYIPEVRIKYLKHKAKKNIYKKNIIAASSVFLKILFQVIKNNKPYEEKKEKLEELKLLEKQLKKTA